MKDAAVETKQLQNGLVLVKIDLPSFHTVTNFLVIRSGSRYETEKNNGIAHFLEHLVFKGTKSYASSREVALAIEGIGGYFNAYTSVDHTAYWNMVPSEQWQTGIQVAAELAFQPTLRAEDMERERGVIIEEIKRMYDDPSSLVEDIHSQTIFGSHSIGRSVIGRERVIQSVTIDDFRDYYQAHYRPSQAYFVVAGNLEGKKIEEELWRHIQDVPEGSVSQPELFVGGNKSDLKLLTRKTDQAHFMLSTVDPSLAIGNRTRYVGAVLNAILGRGMSSRLFMNIRERRGLAYSVYSYVQPYEETGSFNIYGGVNTAKIEEALQAVIDELNDISQNGASNSELSKAIAQVCGQYDLSADRPVDLAGWFGTSRLLGNNATFEEAKEAVRQVSSQDIQQLAQKMFQGSELALSIVGPYKDKDKFSRFLKL